MSVRNSRVRLSEVFKDEFGDHATNNFEITYGDGDASVTIDAVGDPEKNKWIASFWSEAYAAQFFAIWDRIPTMDDVIKFWDVTFPGDASEIISPVKLEGLSSEAEEYLLPEDVNEWEKFFYHFK